jgi:hypothetical protein
MNVQSFGSTQALLDPIGTAVSVVNTFNTLRLRMLPKSKTEIFFGYFPDTLGHSCVFSNKNLKIKSSGFSQVGMLSQAKDFFILEASLVHNHAHTHNALPIQLGTQISHMHKITCSKETKDRLVLRFILDNYLLFRLLYLYD